jgi:GNAT superfamily N-acetyltransferase
MTTTTIRPFAPTEWPLWRTLRLRALADSPDSFCTTLADAQARTDDTWAALLADASSSPRQLPLLALSGDQPAGLAWAQQDGDAVWLYQVWVAPEHRGRGIAQALLTRAIEWAREREAAAVKLDYTVGVVPAARLYESLGFVKVGDPAPLAKRAGLLEQAMQLPL